MYIIHIYIHIYMIYTRIHILCTNIYYIFVIGKRNTIPPNEEEQKRDSVESNTCMHARNNVESPPSLLRKYIYIHTYISIYNMYVC